MTVVTGGSGGSSSAVAYKSLAELRTETPTSIIHRAVDGGVTGGDGFQGHFVWDVSATNADDGALWIKPNSNPAAGRWHRTT